MSKISYEMRLLVRYDFIAAVQRYPPHGVDAGSARCTKGQE
jgi:hypothetical protein